MILEEGWQTSGILLGPRDFYACVPSYTRLKWVGIQGGYQKCRSVKVTPLEDLAYG
jgi:hypothetical protein